MVSGDDELVQAVGMIVSTNLGEWFLNSNFGLARFQILGTKLESDRITQLVTKSILENESRVSSVDKVELVQDDITPRGIKITFTFTKTDGTQLTGQVGV
jgi:phage baseplate assembly protein W